MNLVTPTGLVPLLLGVLMAMPAAAHAQTPGIEGQLESSGKGVGRFRGGLYGALGWGFGSKVTVPGGGTRPSGMHVELGGYGLFNPVRDFADVEATIGLTGVTPSSQSSQGGATTYKSGYLAAIVAAGPVFRLGRGGSALALGAHMQFGNKVLRDSGDAFLQAYPATMKSQPGLYFEYQYQGDATKAIYYSRLAAAKYDMNFRGAPASVNSQAKGGTMATLAFGIKY